jgi:hypothetical protein
MVLVAGQQRVGQGAEADQAAPHRAARQEERQDGAGNDKGRHRRAAAIEKGWRIGHRFKISGSPAACYLLSEIGAS